MALTKISTDGVKDDAITKAKIPANQIETSELGNDCVTNAQIADNAIQAENILDLAKLPHGDSNNDGKFLRANNGADPSFETVAGTTINNNADNRVITGSDTANTLEGESNVIVDGSGNLGVNTTAPVEKFGVAGNMRFVNPTGTTRRINALPSGGYNVGTTGGSAIAFHRISDGGGGSDEIAFETHWQGNRHGESARISKFGGITFNGDTASANALDDYEEGAWTPVDASGGGISVSANNNRYTKVGRMVFAAVRCSFGSSSNGDTAKITLPFVPDNSAISSAVGSACFEQNYDSNNTVMACINDTGGIIFRKNGSGNLKNNQVSSTILRFCVYYMAA